MRAIAAIATLAALLCGSSAPRSGQVAETVAAAGGNLARVLGASTAFRLGRLPQGLTLVQAEADATRRFFALVTTDLDADGDVDVIASNGALDLLVWINDGSGHLTARRASTPYWRAHAFDGDLESPQDEATVSAQDDDDGVPVAHIDLHLVWRDTAVDFLSRALLDRRKSVLVSTHSSRGPPAFVPQRQA